MQGRGRLKTLGPRVSIARPQLVASSVSETQRTRGGSWQRKRDRTMTRDMGMCRCAECRQLGRLRLAHEVDHRRPLWEGGTDADGNLQAIDRDCHAAKSRCEEARRMRPSGWRCVCARCETA